MALTLAENLLSRDQIAARVQELGTQISDEYAGSELVCVGILKGAFVFLSDLIRHIDERVDTRIDFMAVSSYGDATKSAGIVKIVKDLDADIRSKHILIVEDIVDTGLTLSYLSSIIRERLAASTRICALLDKPERREVDVAVDYAGFRIPDKFVVGYGLDAGERWRNLPDIATIEEN
ncbi:MAG: hypoxanthine phosphoribosyltransferase [Synergistales bacterium]|nr:hypoxanthine phosphoribosyltransferase [Synergistales bacterium]